MIAVEPGAIVGLDEAQTVGIELRERNARVVHVVEHAELHGSKPLAAMKLRTSARKGDTGFRKEFRPSYSDGRRARVSSPKSTSSRSWISCGRQRRSNG